MTKPRYQAVPKVTEQEIKPRLVLLTLTSTASLSSWLQPARHSVSRWFCICPTSCRVDGECNSGDPLSHSLLLKERAFGGKSGDLGRGAWLFTWVHSASPYVDSFWCLDFDHQTCWLDLEGSAHARAASPWEAHAVNPAPGTQAKSITLTCQFTERTPGILGAFSHLQVIPHFPQLSLLWQRLLGYQSEHQSGKSSRSPTFLLTILK